MNRTIKDNSLPVIEVHNLTKIYGSAKVVDNLSFDVSRGEIFGFLGPNGAGKTTTLSILEGLQDANQGQVYVMGMDVKLNSRNIKQIIGVQLQSTSLLPDLTVLEQIQLFARFYGVHPDINEINYLLETVGLAQKVSALPDNLSGGQKQRLSLAIALINQPEIVFLDEPTTGLDPQFRHALWQIIRGLKEQGKTVVITTHYLEEAEALCDRVGIIDHGRLVALDSPGALVSRLAGFSSITTSASLPPLEIKVLPGVQTVKCNGSSLQLQTNDMAASLRAILDLAEEQEIDINDLYIRQPNLEDVFLSLTGRMIRN